MGEYEVGYGKPPKASQFKKGQSGNPNGHAARLPSVAVMLRKELNRRVTFVENGRTKTITMEAAYLRQLATKAVKGDNKAIQIILGLRNTLEQPAEVDDDVLGRDDQRVLDTMMKRVREAGNAS
ncbi:DUF5681 domain-containing protein [Rhodanobacter sp. L36]|uniref:DUF5681 domain-containing protein n=1 Tax=Rhodanobacter sp. L36 TaxID=1747221 RepID=UPI00131EA652|nr:DUF5681 domain-containing protein [Rhodanobacter sp. L36]